MPGPISQSSNPASIMKDDWIAELRRDGFKYFVLKAEDFLEALEPDEVELFNMFLYKHECYREGLGKSRSNKYWVVNRDEDYSYKVRELINTKGGKALGRICLGCRDRDKEHTFGIDCTLSDENK